MPRVKQQPGVSPAALTVSQVSKSYGTNRVLDQISLDVAAGQIHGLVGPNGAGKSTLIKIVAGREKPDSGSLSVFGKDIRTEFHRIGVIHQDLGLIEQLTVCENLMLTNPPALGGFLLRGKQERASSAELLARVGIDLDPDALVDRLSLGERSLLAVAKLMRATDARVILLDEVTAALTRRDTDFVMDHMVELAESGLAIIVVTHRLREVATYCNSTSMLRDGELVYSGATPSLEGLQRMFIGDALPETASVAPTTPGSRKVLAELAGARTRASGPNDLRLYSGEVVGLVGSLSSNLYEIGHAVSGHIPLTAGSRSILSRTRPGKGRVVFIPEERRTMGLLRQLEVGVNISASALEDVAVGGWISRRREARRVGQLIDDLGIVPASPRPLIDWLSGGNQQKALMARAAFGEPDVYVLCEPTRGVDLTARHAIYRFIRNACQGGAAVLVITIDTEDVLAVSDHVGIVEDGRITSISPAREMSMFSLLEAVS